MKRNYKTFDVVAEAHRILNELETNGVAHGDSVALDTVRYWSQKHAGKCVTCDQTNSQNAKFYYAG